MSGILGVIFIGGCITALTALAEGSTAALGVALVFALFVVLMAAFVSYGRRRQNELNEFIAADED